MELTLLGTGCPSVDYKRCGSANIVSTKYVKILVDCGSGVTQRLNQAKISSANIDALFLTHLHSDHVVDLYQLIISSWHSYRVKPWAIYGPKGTKKFVKNIMSAWKDERDMTDELLTKVERNNKIMVEFKGTSTISRTD